MRPSKFLQVTISHKLRTKIVTERKKMMEFRKKQWNTDKILKRLAFFQYYIMILDTTPLIILVNILYNLVLSTYCVSVNRHLDIYYLYTKTVLFSTDLRQLNKKS